VGGVQARSADSAGARATVTTPTIIAAIPPACSASMPGETWIRSPKMMTPSRIPMIGSPAAMGGSENCSGPALNALCISQIPIAPAPTSAYGAHVVNSALTPLDCRISRVCLVRASWIPNTRPAPVPVSMARARFFRLRPACTQTNATPAITAAAGQCENDPNDSPIGFADRDADSSATPRHSNSAPITSQNLMEAPDSGTDSTSAKIRLVVSSGSTKDSERCPIDQAARTCPPIRHPIPTSHFGVRMRSSISRRLRNREAGSLAAAFCWKTKPVPISSAASSVSP
jgi:hypothetical protein